MKQQWLEEVLKELNYDAESVKELKQLNSEKFAPLNDQAVVELKEWHDKNGVSDKWKISLFELEFGMGVPDEIIDREKIHCAMEKIKKLRLALRNIGFTETCLLSKADWYASGLYEETGDSPLFGLCARGKHSDLIDELNDLCNKAEKMQKECLSHRPQSRYRRMAHSLACYMKFTLNIAPTMSATGPFGKLLELTLRAFAPDYEADPKSVRERAVKMVKDDVSAEGEPS